jgi:uncharacterized membrane protein
MPEQTMTRTVEARRSLVKALTYRALIVCLDFGTVYLFTGEVRVALGFMVASNVYTTVAYLLHERAWARISWGIRES